MRSELVRAAITTALLCAACGSESSAANGGIESGASQAGRPGGQASAAGSKSSPSAGAAAAGKAALAGTGAAGARAVGPAVSAGSSGAPAAGVAAVANAGAGGGAGVAPASAAGSTGAAAGSTGAVAGSTGAAAGSTGAAASGNPADCDRACLLDVMKSYQDALVAKDSSKVKTAASVKYSENGVVAMFGQTMVWKSVMSLVPDTILNFADTTAGNVASQFVYNDSAQKIYQVRLKVVNHEVTEVESMIVMQGDQFFNPAGMKVEPVFMTAIDPAKRMKREELESITQVYLDYLEGKKGGMMVPFDAMCKRYENGTVTADGLSAFNAQSWSFELTRRILVIDEEAGITWGMFPFSQAASTLVVGEAFKIIEGKIMMIQAVMTYMPPHGVWD